MKRLLVHRIDMTKKERLKVEFLLEICKGILIGIANIVPGVSGGILAISMGIYDKIIYSVTHIFREPKKSIVTLLPYGLGAVAGVFFLSFMIEYLFRVFPVQTGMTFMGFILGGLPGILAKTRMEKSRWKGYLTMFLTFSIIVLPALAGGPSAAKAGKIGYSLSKSTALFGVGIISAATMVIPGVSGSMVLMMIGYYHPLLQKVNQCIRFFLAMEFRMTLESSMILFPFFLGIITGIFLFAKLVEYFLEKHETMACYIIAGLILSSPVAILREYGWNRFSWREMALGLILMYISYQVAVLFGNAGMDLESEQ